MSALAILALSRKSSRPLCANRCMTSNGVKDAAASVWIIDRPYVGPAGHPNYCGDCIKQIQAVWLDLTGTDVQPVRSILTKQQRGRERAAAKLRERMAA